MAERKRVGGLSKVDPAVAAWQTGAAENPATLTAKQKNDRKRIRIYVDITPELKGALEVIAGWKHGEDTSISQVTEMLLTFAALAYQRGDAELAAAFRDGKTHAKTPRFTWNLEVPESWVTKLEQFSPYGKDGGKDNGKNEFAV